MMPLRRWLQLTTFVLAIAACGGGDGDTAATSGTGGEGTGAGATGGAGGSGGSAGGGAGGDTGSGGEASGGGASGGGGSGGSAALPLDGFGTLSGDCGEIEPGELMTGSAPFEIVNAIDFMMLSFDSSLLSAGGQTIFDDPNAGGSSKESEAIAYDVLYRCELATLLKTETEIVYDTSGKITDFLVEVDGLKVGVSVVRAFAFMTEYTVQNAFDTMTDKLLDIQESTANVSPGDAWEKQILAVISEKPENTANVVTALGMIDAGTRGDTIVVVTTTNGDDAFIY